jgi:hypothetical protein
MEAMAELLQRTGSRAAEQMQSSSSSGAHTVGSLERRAAAHATAGQQHTPFELGMRGNKEGINTPRARTEVASWYAGQVPEPP